ncbi:sensor histidine kinase [Nibrella viscosa]
MMMVYGVSGIIYFTLQMTNPQNPFSNAFTAVLISNFTNAFIVIVCCFLFRLVAPKIKSAGLHHLYLSLIVAVLIFIVNGFLWRFWLLDMIRGNQSEVNTSGSWAYMMAPILVANIFYYFQRQAQTFTRKISEQEYQLLTLEKLKTRAELEALQAKINPHFLYNALNSIAGLVHDEPDRAERMVLLLSKLFRYTTGLKDKYFSSIATELEMVRTYLEVEQVRFGDRLSYRIDIADPTLTDLPIPQFLLQPLVENAIKHGIAKIAGPGGIIIRIQAEAGWLNLRIHDSGPSFPEQLMSGYGLQSIQDKLRLLYGDDGRMLVHNQPQKEIVIQLKIERLTSAVPVGMNAWADAGLNTESTIACKNT